MTENASPITPTGINLHRKSRLLEVSFADGTRFMFPCEYLRVFCSAGTGADRPVHGKERVEITTIEARGTAALQLEFDDGCSGSYSWDTLHDLGIHYEHNWHDYLQQLAQHDLQRNAGRAAGTDGRIVVRLLYFIQLAKLAGRDEEDVELPGSVTNVETLLAWLRSRSEHWSEDFADDRVQVTVNKHFAEPFTLLEHGDEVALVPRPQ